MKLSDVVQVRVPVDVLNSSIDYPADVILESAASVVCDLKANLTDGKPVQIKADLVGFVAGLDAINIAMDRNKSLMDDPITRDKLYSILADVEYNSSEKTMAMIVRQAEKNQAVVAKWKALFQDTPNFAKALDGLARDISAHVSYLRTKGAATAQKRPAQNISVDAAPALL